MEMDYNDILEYQSQVYPFLLIDHADEVIPGKSARGYKFLNMNDWFFQYHFPGDPLMPGVLLTEAIDQMAALAIAALPDLKAKRGYLSSIKSAKFYVPVRPGSILYIESEIIEYNRGVVHCQGRCKVKDEVVCEAELTFVLPDVLEQYKVQKAR
jgi:3-hydroxyacyl-[acyl-carrier-protein] dehydratase